MEARRPIGLIITLSPREIKHTKIESSM
uniref:Uncharacterized protein n=1 Tax=Anguilla anguilla TaxID=7936 RepID=A0A0E9SL59_ANGAN